LKVKNQKRGVVTLTKDRVSFLRRGYSKSYGNMENSAMMFYLFGWFFKETLLAIQKGYEKLLVGTKNLPTIFLCGETVSAKSRLSAILMKNLSRCYRVNSIANKPCREKGRG
jgi:hypothetical protein